MSVVIEKIDWKLLGEQKQDLIMVLDVLSAELGSKKESLVGILHLLDSIQDDAVDAGIATEEEVFGD